MNQQRFPVIHRLDDLIECEVDGNSRWCDADEVYEKIEQLETDAEKHDRECVAQDERKDKEIERLIEVNKACHALIKAQGNAIKRLRKALLGHRADLHCYSSRPCPTCRQSAEALEIVRKVPNNCAREDWDKEALKEDK